MTVTNSSAPTNQNKDIPRSEPEQEIPEAILEAGTLIEDCDFIGVCKSPELSREEVEAAGPMYVWNNKEKGIKVGVFKNKNWAEDGYPFTAAKWIETTQGEEYWRYTHIAENWEQAINATENNIDMKVFLIESNFAEYYSDWQERTGGTEYEPPKPSWES
jgi:hypothetical protein